VSWRFGLVVANTERKMTRKTIGMRAKKRHDTGALQNADAMR